MLHRFFWALAVISTGLSSGAHAADGENAKPNFVFIIADDCTYLDLECYGGQAKTPNLNKLRGEGMKFKRCFQAAPMCSPTRHCLYTGIYPVKSGAHPNHTFVKEGTKSVAHYLKDAGYRVALSGKTHISPRSSFPFEFSGKKNNPDPAAIGKLFSESAAKNTPFCLFACSNEPHTPWNLGDASAYPPASLKLPPNYVDTPETRENFSRYLAEVTYFDKQVGEILGLLDKHELAKNTMVMVVSEQGNAFPFAKWTCYEVGVASGMIVRWPGRVRPETTTDAMVEYLDVVPTFLEAAGVKDMPAALEGKSFLGVLEGKSNEHKKYSFAIQSSRGINAGPEFYGIRTVRSADYRYIRNLTPEVEFKNTMMSSEWFRSWVKKASSGDKRAAELVRKFSKRPGEELYDANADPWNLKNLASDPAYVSIKSELSEQLDAWMKSQGDLGQATELDSKNRQGRANKKRKKNPRKKPKK